MSRNSISPSPPPQAPTAATPGPRAAALQKIFSQALTSSLRANSYQNFSACFPTPATYCPSALEGVWKQLNTRLQEECRRDFEKILQERNVIEGLNQWDTILEDARRRKDKSVEGEKPPRPMHTLSAEELYMACLAPVLARVQGEVKEKLEVTQQRNQRVMEEVKMQRMEIEGIMAGLEAKVKDLEGAAEGMEGGEVKRLKQESWEVEQEMVVAT